VKQINILAILLVDACHTSRLSTDCSLSNR